MNIPFNIDDENPCPLRFFQLKCFRQPETHSFNTQNAAQNIGQHTQAK